VASKKCSWSGEGGDCGKVIHIIMGYIGVSGPSVGKTDP